MSAPKSKVKVLLRTRPTSNFAQDVISFGSDRKSVHIHIPKDSEGGHINNQQENWDFKLDRILHNAGQETMFEEAALPIIKTLLDGYNGTLMAYGQTGAGKTFTMTGASENYKHRGLVPRTISQVFREIADRPETAYTVRISYLEIYNEQMVDLLAGSGVPAASGGMHPQGSTASLNVVEDKTGTATVRGLRICLANSEEEALNFLFDGETNRSISEHQLNRCSTRSHAIFTIHLESRSRVESSERVIYSKLNLVDLAGSERISKTKTSGQSLKEAKYINKSLSFLEQVIVALADKKREHIPFRQSKLTNVLRDALGGNCNTLLVANIWGEKQHIEETISTLRFATRMMCVSTVPQINVQYDPVALLKKYEREIKELKMELSMHDTLSNKSHVQYEPYSESQRSELAKVLRGFVDGEIDEIEVINLRQIRELFNGFKNMVRVAELDADDRGHKLIASQSNLAAATATNAPSSAATDSKNIITAASNEVEGVGDIDGGGFGIGMAPKNAKKRIPGGKKSGKGGVQQGSQLAQILSGAQATGTDDDEEDSREHTAESNQIPSAGMKESDFGGGMVSGHSLGPPSRKVPGSRAQEYENFKQGRGQELNKIFTENKGVLREKRSVARDAAVKLNKVKEQIDSAKSRLDKKIRERTSGDSYDPKNSESVVIDEEEYNLINSMKQLKGSYRQQYAALSEVRSEIDYCSRLVDQCRQRLMTEFESWYVKSYGANEVAGTSQEEDVIDIGEKFDRLQSERMSHEDPDSVPYYNARREVERKRAVVNRRKIK
ncbi:MAG: hypothetical protein SGCHY_000372 [Lobulomycetales sp.]